MNNVPNKEGIWEWFEEDGTQRLVAVYNVGQFHPHFRVYWWGGYYNVDDQPDQRAEWANRWGEYAGPLGSIKEEDLYLFPTPEQRKEILKKYEKSA